MLWYPCQHWHILPSSNRSKLKKERCMNDSIVIKIESGIVAEIFSTSPVQVTVVDYDMIEGGETYELREKKRSFPCLPSNSSTTSISRNWSSRSCSNAVGPLILSRCRRLRKRSKQRYKTQWNNRRLITPLRIFLSVTET